MRIKNPLCAEAQRVMTWDDTFTFRCYPGIDCFNSCCRDVTIFLHSLDVINLRRRLGMNSEDFLEQYTHIVVSPTSGLPAVVLRMQENEAKTCPFVTPQGCSVYEDRPYSCRLYPLDTEQGVEYTFIVSAERCHGLRESEMWTVERWRKEEGLYAYDDPDHNLKDVMHADQQWEQKIADPRMQDMYLMALYDLDRFREFVFKSTFLHKFRVDDDILERIKTDDLALLYFAAQWLRFVLFGKKGFLKIEPEYLDRKKKEILDCQE